MFQKWSSLPRSASFSRLVKEVPSPTFRPKLSFADNLFPPYLIPPSLTSRKPPPHTQNKPITNPFLQISGSRRSSQCYRCGVAGHFAKSCSLPVRCYACRGFGHKSYSCRKTVLAVSSEGSVAAPWIPISSTPETSLASDIMLLDPDVMRCLEPLSFGSYSQLGEHTSGVDQPVSAVQCEEEDCNGLVDRHFLVPRSRPLPYAGNIFGCGSFSLGKWRGGGKGLDVSLSSGIGRQQNRLRRSRQDFLQGLRFFAHSCVLPSTPGWDSAPLLSDDLSGHVVMGSSEAEQDLKDIDLPIIAEEPYSSDEEFFPPSHGSSAPSQVELNLDPIQLEVILDFDIIDDLEVCCSDDGFPLQSSPVAQVVLLPKLSKSAPKPVRRSPRLNKA